MREIKEFHAFCIFVAITAWGWAISTKLSVVIERLDVMIKLMGGA
jgi:hypothetical protein